MGTKTSITILLAGLLAIILGLLCILTPWYWYRQLVLLPARRDLDRIITKYEYNTRQAMREPKVRVVPNEENLAGPDALIFYVIYGPTTTDYPGKYVVRRRLVRASRVYVDRDPIGTAVTLAAARELVPAGKFCMQRDERDDPVIIESWL